MQQVVAQALRSTAQPRVVVPSCYLDLMVEHASIGPVEAGVLLIGATCTKVLGLGMLGLLAYQSLMAPNPTDSAKDD